MLPLIITLTKYRKDTNDFEARTANNTKIIVDPFVGCAIDLSDEDYAAGKGAQYVGKTYKLLKYTVSDECILPHEKQMINIRGK